jgi:hypothetical protein
MTTEAKFMATLEYISTNVSSSLASDVRLRIATAAKLSDDPDTLIEDLVLGISTKGAGVFVTNSKVRRQALRALLLCQEVYLGTACLGYDARSGIQGGWPKPTIDFWTSKSEATMVKGIQMYMPMVNARADALSAVASRLRPTTVDAQKLPKRIHTVTRDDRNFPVESTCYRAVQSWLLAAGHVSLQWFLKSFVVGPPTGVKVNDDNCVAAQLLGVFGPGTMVNVTDNPAIAATMMVAGDVVYMYRAHSNGQPKFGGQLGHWMVCESNRMGYGCNNFEEYEAAGVNRGYDRADIINQIKAMQHDTVVPGTKDWHFIRIYKPADIERFPS